MGYLRINADHSATLYQSDPDRNTGADEQLTLQRTPEGGSRLLLGFNGERVTELLASRPTGSYGLSLHLYASHAEHLPDPLVVTAQPMLTDWKAGVGFLNQTPPDSEGSTWNSSGYGPWNPASYAGTGSASVTIGYNDPVKDIRLDLSGWNLSFASSAGLLIRRQDEPQTGSVASYLHFYSRHTHTIYRPHLTVGYDDTVYAPTGSVLTALDRPMVSLERNPTVLYGGYRQRIDVMARARYPQRTWNRRYPYAVSSQLPAGTCWRLRDVRTGEIVTAHHPVFTRLSADKDGPYFYWDTHDLPTGRYYQFDLLIPASPTGLLTGSGDRILIQPDSTLFYLRG